MKRNTIKISLFLCLFSTKIFAQYESEESTFKRQLGHLQESYDAKVKYLNELNGGTFVSVGDVDKSIPVMRDTFELGMKIRAMQRNLEKINKIRKASK